MISEVVMPQMGADMVEGTVVRWLKQEGDPVTRGEIIAEIETDKANVEIEAFEGGVFRRALAAEGDVVEVGEVIAVIAAPEDDISKYNGAAAAPAGKSTETAPLDRPSPSPRREEGGDGRETPKPAASAPADSLSPSPRSGVGEEVQRANGRLRASPLARRIAQERGVDLARVEGSGPGGRIVRRDVESAPAGADARPAPGREVSRPAGPPSKMRRAIARRMSQSKREAPHYYLLVDLDMTEAMTFREQVNATQPDDARVSVNDLIVRACALALQRHPEFNATIAGDEVTRHGAQHVCIGIALEDGLIAPAILDAGTKTLLQIGHDSKDLAARAKGGALRPDEITAGTFTISNLGAFGVEALIAIIQPPQTAILGVGAVTSQPAVRDGGVVVRQLMKVALSADHRVTDGAEGARFLAEIKNLLEQPLLLVL